MTTTAETIDVYHIYKLIDPRDNLPFYVGITIDLERRYHDHKNNPVKNQSLHDRISEIHNAGLALIMERIETVEGTQQKALRREAHWIRTLRAEGLVLVNGTFTDRRQKTVYLPPDVEQWLNVQSAVERREISEIVADALKMYRMTH